jgi:hypothetical protein
MFTIKQDRLIWRAAMLAFKILKDQGRLDSAGSLLLIWNAATKDGSVFPAALIPDAQNAVVDRLSLIRSRWYLGEQLCPELAT